MKNPNTIKAYDFLRGKILNGDFPPGAFLSGKKLSAEIGVSRTPMREALRQLEYDELVVITPKIGAAVRTMSAKEFDDLQGYRQALDVFTVGRAAAMRTQNDLAKFEKILEGMSTCLSELEETPSDEGALLRSARHDIEFHRMIVDIADNEMIKVKYERANLLQRVVLPSLATNREIRREAAVLIKLKAVYDEHTEIFEAIRKGDPRCARAAMRGHLEHSRNLLENEGAGSGDALPANALVDFV